MARAASAAARESYTRAYQHLLRWSPSCKQEWAHGPPQKGWITNNFGFPGMEPSSSCGKRKRCQQGSVLNRLLETSLMMCDSCSRGLHVLSDIEWLSKQREAPPSPDTVHFGSCPAQPLSRILPRQSLGSLLRISWHAACGAKLEYSFLR